MTFFQKLAYALFYFHIIKCDLALGAPNDLDNAQRNHVEPSIYKSPVSELLTRLNGL